MYSHTPLSQLFALLPLLGLFAIAVLCRLRLRQVRSDSGARSPRSTNRPGGTPRMRLRAADLVWATLPALVLAWVTAWCALGLVTAEPPALLALVAACVGQAAVALWREELLGRVEGTIPWQAAEAEPAAQADECALEELAEASKDSTPQNCPTDVDAGGAPGAEAADESTAGTAGTPQHTAKPKRDHADKARAFLSSPAGRAVKNALCLAAATWLAFLALETPWNAIVSELPLVSVAVECALLGLAVVGCYLVAQRHGGGGVVAVCAASGIGLAQYFLALFKGAAILPSDVLGIGTAVAVSQNYTYLMSSTALGGITYAVLAGAALSLARRRPGLQASGPRQHRLSQGRFAAPLTRTLCGLAALAACVALFLVPSYRDVFGVYIPDYWWALNRYSEYGFLPTFASAVQDLPIAMPDGYSDESAYALEASYVQRQQNADTATGHAEAANQFSRLRPSIVAIMNESFCDLSAFDELGGVYQGPEFLTTGTDDALAKGSLAVSVLGGGTCNTEFEFLTGTSMRFVGDGKYPYTLYDFSEAPSLARQLADLGYHTTALHPNKATNWNRDRVYAQMGFESTQFDDSFADDPEYHTGVSDEATYDHVLSILRSSDEPQFVFDVTMQNHSGYDTGKIPEEDRVDLDLPALDDATAAEVDEYVACVNESDRALREFLGELRQLDRPVVVIFFGDHQPLFTPEVNDAYFPDEDDDLAHSERTHQTSYLVWANYEVAGSKRGTGAAEAGTTADAAERGAATVATEGGIAEDASAENTTGAVGPSEATKARAGQDSAEAATDTPTSASQLAAWALWQVGAPLTTYQEAVLGTSQTVPAINAIGYLTADGTWHPTAEPDQTLSDLASIEYLDFARTVE